MALYVANCTKQTFELHYWVAGNKAPFQVKIRPGGQENVYPQGTRMDHEHIVEQHRMYGLIPVSEIDRTQAFIGQCYQFDKPIPVDRLMSNFERNEDWLNEQALERRKEAAAATSIKMSEIAQESGSEVVSLEMDIVEQKRPGVDVEVAERIEIDNSNPNQPTRGRGRPRRN